MAAERFEEMSRNAEQVQRSVLRRILQENATCEYLRTCGVEEVAGLEDEEEMVRRFKERVPLASYAHFQPFIHRILDGDTSPLLTSAPIRAMCLSSGTSNGRQKYIPYFDGLKTGTMEVAHIATTFRDRVYPLTSNARILEFNFIGPVSTTKGGVRVAVATTHLIHDETFKMRQKISKLASCYPDEVVFAQNFHQGVYCRLLCGLIHAAKVEVINAVFAHALLEVLHTLEIEWQSLCHDIKIGHLNNKITDPSLRNGIMSQVLTQPNPHVADKLIATFTMACLSSSWRGVVKQIWPRCKYVLSIVTGSMEIYVEKLQYYLGDKVAIVSADYGATEGWVATNINPCDHPSNVSFTVVPSLGYFEFIPYFKTNENELILASSTLSSSNADAFDDVKPIDLTKVKVGQEYEIVMTTTGGLYRYRLGDILRVTGFFNHTPQFKYICRKDVILSINVDKVTEEDLNIAMKKVANKLQDCSTMRSIDYTSYARIQNNPPHYVIFWEVEGAQVESTENQKLFNDCATLVDAAFIEHGYVTSRKLGTIGSLELCIVQLGTFKRVLDYLMTRFGISITQYKTPRCILPSSFNIISILQETTLATFLSSLTFQ